MTKGIIFPVLSILFPCLLVLESSVTVLACSTTQVGVNLEECPVCTAVATEDEILQLEYTAYEWEVPAQDVTTGETGTWKITVKTYALSGTNSPECQTPSVPSPVLRWNKGQKVRLNISNRLDEYVSASSREKVEYYTNIHTHGLHISPYEDDPTIDIIAGTWHYYEFNVPRNHAGGTHWYHPHVHTLSELSVGAGAAGLLIINDADDGTEIPNEILNLEERSIVIQRMYPAKLNSLHTGYIGRFDGIHGLYPREYLDDEIFTLSQPEGLDFGIFDQKTFFTFVNGYIRPVINIEQGRWFRLRMLYIAGEDPDDMIADGRFYFDGDCEVKLIAKDGVYLKQSRNMDFSTQRILLHPASRCDILVKCFDPASLIMESFNQLGQVLTSSSIMEIHVRQETLPDQGLPIDFRLSPCLPKYLPDMLGDDVQISRVPPPGVDLSTIRSKILNNDWIENDRTLKIEVTPFEIDGDPFTGYGRNDYNITIMRLGEVYEWRLIHGLHPLHLHINHFQLQHNIHDGTGFHQVGDFVDTIATLCPASGCLEVESEAFPRDEVERITFRIFPDTYTGRLLIHCHNYDHADSGAKGEAWIIENPETTLGSADEEWNEGCNLPLQLETNSPTNSPSRFPTSSAPTTQSPTPAPTSSTPTSSPNTMLDVTIFPLQNNEISTSSGLKLEGNIVTRQSGQLEFHWSEQSNKLIPGEDFFQGINLPVIYVYPYKLQDREIYVFNLVASLEGVITSDSIVVIGNQAPSGGIVRVNSNSGIAAIDSFSFSTSEWDLANEDDLPIRYKFFILFDEDSSSKMSISVLQDAPLLQTTLPYLGGNTGSLVRITASVTDSAGAESDIAEPEVIIITPPISFDTPTVQENVNELFERVIETDSAPEMLRLIFSILSVINNNANDIVQKDNSLAVKHMQFIPLVERELQAGKLGLDLLNGEMDLLLLAIMEISKAENLTPEFLHRVLKLIHELLVLVLSELDSHSNARNLAFEVSDFFLHITTKALGELVDTSARTLKGDSYCIFITHVELTLDFLSRVSQFNSIPGLYTRLLDGEVLDLRTQRYEYSSEIPVELNFRDSSFKLEMNGNLLNTSLITSILVVGISWHLDIHHVEIENNCAIRNVQLSDFEGRLLRQRELTNNEQQILLSPVVRLIVLGEAHHETHDILLNSEVELSFTPDAQSEYAGEFGHSALQPLCGLWNEDLSKYDSTPCTLPIEDMNSQTYKCKCENMGDFVLFADSNNAGVVKKSRLFVSFMTISLLAVLFLLMAMCYQFDKKDAEKVQKAAHVFILQRWMQLSHDESPHNALLRIERQFLSRWKIYTLAHAATQDSFHLKHNYPQADEESFLEVLRRNHSVIGIITHFNPLVSRVLRMCIPISLFCTNIGLSAMFINFEKIVSRDIPLVIFLPSLSILLLIPAAHFMFSIYVKERRSYFHRTAFLYFTSLETRKLDDTDIFVRKCYDELFISKQKLKSLYRDYEKTLPYTERAYNKMKHWFCFSRSDYMVNRIYGGYADRTETYLLNQKHVRDIELNYGLRRFTRPLLALIASFVVYLAIMCICAIHYVTIHVDSTKTIVLYCVCAILAHLVSCILYEPFLHYLFHISSFRYLNFAPEYRLSAYSDAPLKIPYELTSYVSQDPNPRVLRISYYAEKVQKDPIDQPAEAYGHESYPATVNVNSVEVVDKKVGGVGDVDRGSKAIRVSSNTSTMNKKKKAATRKSRIVSGTSSEDGEDSSSATSYDSSSTESEDRSDESDHKLIRSKSSQKSKNRISQRKDSSNKKRSKKSKQRSSSGEQRLSLHKPRKKRSKNRK